MKHNSRCGNVYLVVLPDGSLISTPADATPLRGSPLTIARRIIATQSSRTLARFQPDETCKLEVYRRDKPMWRQKRKQTKRNVLCEKTTCGTFRMCEVASRPRDGRGCV